MISRLIFQFPSGERINAHKLILTLFSPVFEAEFYGSLNQDGEILITDIGRRRSSSSSVV
jgi:hypothetical protein